jgi:photosystem II stability/assembly factor-like uncharacterized protein
MLVALSLVSCDPGDELDQQASEVVVANGGIPRRSTWSYWDRGGDLGTAWRFGGYDDSSWARGTGPLGYGETYLSTTIGYGGNPSAKYITSYFRAQFTIDDPDSVQSMVVELMFDDGAVVYLNGVKILAAGMPTSGTVTASTLATPGHEANNSYMSTQAPSFLPALVPGVNTVAVEVHQNAASSSDLVFDVAVNLTLRPPTTNDDIPRGSVWKYWDKGSDLGNGWRSRTFDDSAWSSGAAPLGYGESYLATPIGYGPDASHKYITTYFRGELYVEDPAAITQILAETILDDGMVVYVNGNELVRHYMPSGPINASTLAMGHETGPNYESYYYTPAKDFMVPGRNVIAVEVHQASASSSDLTFDLALDVETATRQPTQRGIPSGSTWGFWDRGTDLGTAWRAPGYEETGWRAGAAPLGFGESYIATATAAGPITTYFRHDFTRSGSPSNWVLEAKYDDGFIAYLNGVEVLRVGLPGGTVTASTLATGHEAGTYQRFPIPGGESRVVDGLNTLAIEVHQSSATSSDLVWDARLVPENAWPVTWTPQISGTNQTLFDAWFTDAQHGWVVGSGATLLRTSDGGAHWVSQDLGDTSPLFTAIQFADAQHGWIAAWDHLLATTDGGATWFVQSNLRAFDISFVSASTGWMQAGGAIYRTDDGGAHWQVQYDNPDIDVSDIDFVDASQGWAIALIDGMVEGEASGTTMILHTSDGGASWQRQAAVGCCWERNLSTLDAVSPSLAWAGGVGSQHTALGELKYVTRDGGGTWTSVPDSSNGTSLNDIQFLDASIGFAVGYAGSIIRTSDGGATWTVDETARWADIPDHTSSEKPTMLGVFMRDATTGWAVGDSGTILHLGG